MNYLNLLVYALLDVPAHFAKRAVEAVWGDCAECERLREQVEYWKWLHDVEEAGADACEKSRDEARADLDRIRTTLSLPDSATVDEVCERIKADRGHGHWCASKDAHIEMLEARLSRLGDAIGVDVDGGVEAACERARELVAVKRKHDAWAHVLAADDVRTKGKSKLHTADIIASDREQLRKLADLRERYELALEDERAACSKLIRERDAANKTIRMLAHSPHQELFGQLHLTEQRLNAARDRIDQLEHERDELAAELAIEPTHGDMMRRVRHMTGMDEGARIEAASDPDVVKLAWAKEDPLQVAGATRLLREHQYIYASDAIHALARAHITTEREVASLRELYEELLAACHSFRDALIRSTPHRFDDERKWRQVVDRQSAGKDGK